MNSFLKWVIIGAFIVALGVIQSWHSPHATPVGAVTLQQTQYDLNICMHDCMTHCVVQSGMEQPCTDACNKKCGGP